MLLSWILFTIILAWDILTDYRKWVKNIQINHTEEAILRVILVSPTTLGISNNLEVCSFCGIILSLFFQFSLWWFFFDGFYNLLRKKSWLYPGSDDKKGDSFLDTYLMKLTEKQIGFLKIGLIMLSGYIFVSFS